MFDAEDPDALTVYAPSDAHVEPSPAAAERGVDLLCEKSLEITAERIGEMDAAEAASTPCRRLQPALRSRRPATPRRRQRGTLRRPRGRERGGLRWRDDDFCDGSWQGSRALDGGGALLNQSNHGVDASHG